MQLSRSRRARLDSPAALSCTKYSQFHMIVELRARFAATIVLTALWSSAACAQVQGLGVAENDLAARRHLDFNGKPCLQSSGTSKPLASNPRILNHAVVLENHCSEKIKAKVCYYRSDECTDVEVPPRSQREQIIGVFPAMQTFRYEVREQF
jgi:hypothetical protein